MSDENKGPENEEPANKEPGTEEQEKPAAPERAPVIFLKGRSNELEVLRRSLVMDSGNEVQESSTGWAPQLAKKNLPCIVIAEARDEAESIKVLTLCKSLVNELRAKKVKIAVVSKLAGRAFSKQLDFYGHVEYIQAPIAEKALEFKVTVLTKALQAELEKKFEKEQRRQALQAAPKAVEAEAGGEKKPNFQIVKGSTAPDVSTEFVRVGRPKEEEPKKPLSHLMDLAMKFEKEEPEGKSTVKTEHFLNPKWRRHDLSPEQKAEYRRRLSGPDEMTQWRNRLAPEKQQDARRAPGAQGKLQGTPPPKAAEHAPQGAQDTQPKLADIQPETPRAKQDTSGGTRQPAASTSAPNPLSEKPVLPSREWKVRTRRAPETAPEKFPGAAKPASQAQAFHKAAEQAKTAEQAAQAAKKESQKMADASGQSAAPKLEVSATPAGGRPDKTPTQTQAFHKAAQQARERPAGKDVGRISPLEKSLAQEPSTRGSASGSAAKLPAAPDALSLISLAVQWSDILYASGPLPEEGDAAGAVLGKFCEMLRFACNADGVAVLRADANGTCALLAEAAAPGSAFGALDSVHVESAERAIRAGVASYEEIEGGARMIEAYFPLKDVSGAVVVRLARTNPFFARMDQLASAASLVRGVLGGLGGRFAA